MSQIANNHSCQLRYSSSQTQHPSKDSLVLTSVSQQGHVQENMQVVCLWLVETEAESQSEVHVYVCVCLSGKGSCRNWHNKKIWGPVWGPRGQERGAALLLQPERLCQQGSYRMERGNCPPGKGINQDLQEPKPDKTK